MGVNTSYCEAGKGSLSFLIYVLFNLYQGVNAKEYCHTLEGIKECANGCCGDNWRNNVSCCPFHPATFTILGIALVIVFIAYCIINAMKRRNRRKTVIKPKVYTDTKQVSSVSYVRVATGILKKYPSNLPPSYLNGQELRIHNTDVPPTYSDDLNYLPR
ncbi:uncharacterized protein LOC110452656 [Mizuhopecten yessoensis]|uniref:Uncharacterized protein n=1 Tax=Mizuhopecten yessoensis TaxID=6573 RepID=A0A210QJJ6_MIZYE|nr:uncharacterized protein LOC110452656 [Mizuhopecten yessoensis]OWF48761.1 hypothetical protein KP79_PYT11978 [Mizuhopecten yessoensis]